MTEEDLFAAYMVHPDTNKQVVAALLDDCMADADQRAVMTVLNVVLREKDQ